MRCHDYCDLYVDLIGPLKSNLQRFDLPYPEAVFEINYFRENPRPCEQTCSYFAWRSVDGNSAVYILCRELYPGRFRPTLTHTFVKLLADHSLLDTCFTQNIDTLERQAGIPPEKLVEAHGSFASQRCIDCKREVDDARMRTAVEAGQVLYCEQEGCGGLVKPDIVFFGESVSRLHWSIPHRSQLTTRPP